MLLCQTGPRPLTTVNPEDLPVWRSGRETYHGPVPNGRYPGETKVKGILKHGQQSSTEVKTT